jgi:hypothetical protein
MSVVNLSPSQTDVSITPDQRRAAVYAAIWLSGSPHEWEWSRTDQISMARFVLWAEQRLSAIEQIAGGKLSHLEQAPSQEAGQ